MSQKKIWKFILKNSSYYLYNSLHTISNIQHSAHHMNLKHKTSLSSSSRILYVILHVPSSGIVIYVSYFILKFSKVNFIRLEKIQNKRRNFDTKKIINILTESLKIIDFSFFTWLRRIFIFSFVYTVDSYTSSDD